MQVLHVAKDLGFANEYEDAFCVGEKSGTAAIADGVASAVFSGLWSRIVTQALVDDPPDMNDHGAFCTWLKERRAVWLGQIDFPRLPMNLQAKLRQVGGAFCTLLWIKLSPTSVAAVSTYRLTAHALGDATLFHVRDGAVLQSFPMTHSADFDLDPQSLCSVDWNRDQNLKFQSLETDCELGDLLVLTTDAVAKWILSTLETGGAIDWQSYVWIDEAAWAEAIESLRSNHLIRRDDSTMVLLSVGKEFDSPIGETVSNRVQEVSCSPDVASDAGSISADGTKADLVSSDADGQLTVDTHESLIPAADPIVP